VLSLDWRTKLDKGAQKGVQKKSRKAASLVKQKTSSDQSWNKNFRRELFVTNYGRAQHVKIGGEKGAEIP